MLFFDILGVFTGFITIGVFTTLFILYYLCNFADFMNEPGLN